jgi:hypothetical protein
VITSGMIAFAIARAKRILLISSRCRSSGRLWSGSASSARQ